MSKREQFYQAWWYLKEHKAFYVKRFDDVYFDGALHIDVAKINPKLGMIDDNEKNNTKIQIWLECGKYDNKIKQFTHDVRLDCGADTFEEAIIKLAELVKEYYT